MYVCTMIQYSTRCVIFSVCTRNKDVNISKQTVQYILDLEPRMQYILDLEPTVQYFLDLEPRMQCILDIKQTVQYILDIESRV